MSYLIPIKFHLKSNCHAILLVHLKQYFNTIIRSLHNDRGGESFFAALKPIDTMANATGAGDAFMAGLVSSIVRGMNMRCSVKYALAAGIAAIMSEETINENMSDALIRNIIEKYS